MKIDFCLKREKIRLKIGGQVFFYAFDPAYLRRGITEETLAKYLAITIDPQVHRDLIKDFPDQTEEVLEALWRQMFFTLRMVRKH